MQNIKRLIITGSAKSYSKTKVILERAKGLLNIEEIIYLTDDKPAFIASSEADRFRYLKETLVITTRKTTPFITTFASPGKIVEDIGSILTLGWHCVYNCNFCYLIGSSYQRQWQEIYVNLDELERQMVLEKYVHNSILTLWTMLSNYSNEPLLKIPENLKKTADWIRGNFIRKNIDTDEAAVDFLENNYSKLLNKLKKSEIENESSLKNKINEFYTSNKNHIPWLNVSEYFDFLGIDPLTNFSSDLMKILEKHPEIRLSMRTKSANVEDILKYKAQGNVKIAMNFNTQYAIDNYEIDTDSLKDRLEAAIKIQNAGGFRLKIVVEPILVYDGYESDYLDLIDQIMENIDLEKIEDFSFGCIRYKTKLINHINEVYPGNNLNNSDSNLINYAKDRIRYDERIRKNIYSKIIKKLKVHTDLVMRLAAETPEMWEALKLNKEEHISKSVKQSLIHEVQ